MTYKNNKHQPTLNLSSKNDKTSKSKTDSTRKILNCHQNFEKYTKNLKRLSNSFCKICNMNNKKSCNSFYYKNHSFSTLAKFYEKLTILTS